MIEMVRSQIFNGIRFGIDMALLTLELQQNRISPLYRQLYDFIKGEVRSGSLKAGEKLPSKRNLSTHLKISQNTVETAYGQLVAEGYIRSAARSGFYVCSLEMPSLTTEMQPVPIRSISDEIAKKTYKYDFRTNSIDTAYFPFATWARIQKEIMHEGNRELLNMPDPQGDHLLRESISKYLHEFRGVNCLPEQIVVGAGTEYLLGLIIQILGRSCVWAIENPGYSKTYLVLKNNGVKTNLTSLDDEGIRISDLTTSDSNIVYITPSHHFPLGIIMPMHRRMQLLKWANDSDDRYIIEDDYDSEFRFNGRPIPALQGLDPNDKVIYISTFSKSIAPSMRVSYVILPPKLLAKYRKEFSFYSSTVSRFEQYALYKFMADGYFERHLNRMRNIYRARKDKFVEEIKRLPFADKIEIIGENAGLHLLLKIHGEMKEKELLRRAEKVGVKLYGLSEYYIKPETDMPDNVVVLGYSKFTADEITDAVQSLKNAW